MHFKYNSETTFFIVLIFMWLNVTNVLAQSSFNWNLPDAEEVSASISRASLDELIEDLPKSITAEDPFLTLINAQNPRESEMWIEVTYGPNEQPFAAVIADPFNQMMYDASIAGYSFQLVSGYRSMAQQAYNREARVNSYLNQGLSYDEALYWTDLYYAPVDSSEHMTGLAIDLLGNDWTAVGGGLSGDYGFYGSAIWLQENAPYYGFILRYPEGKTHITGYNYEPWHYRYVGAEHAIYMHRHGLTLEEYLTLAKERELQEVKAEKRAQAEEAAMAAAEEWVGASQELIFKSIFPSVE